MEHPIKIDDLGVPLFLETPILAISLYGKTVLSLDNLEIKIQIASPNGSCP